MTVLKQNVTYQNLELNKHNVQYSNAVRSSAVIVKLAQEVSTALFTQPHRDIKMKSFTIISVWGKGKSLNNSPETMRALCLPN